MIARIGDHIGERQRGVARGRGRLTANARREIDGDAQHTAGLMRDELRRRCAIDVESLDADPGALRDALERRERALRLAAQAREQARVDEAVAAPLLVTAGVADREQERDQAARDVAPDDGQRAEHLYDSAERRRELAADLDDVADEETVEARVVADTSQARPAQDAVTGGPARTPTARRSRGKGNQVRTPARRPDRGR